MTPAERDALVKRLRNAAVKSMDEGLSTDDTYLLNEAADAIAAITAQPSAGEPVAIVATLMRGQTANPDRGFMLLANEMPSAGTKLYTHPAPSESSPETVVVPRTFLADMGERLRECGEDEAADAVAYLLNPIGDMHPIIRAASPGAQKGEA